jgi:hypothetical protein
MTRIRVIVAHAQEDVVGRAMVEIVSNSLDLCLVDTIDSLAGEPKTMIREPDHFDAIILVGAPPEVEDWSRELLEWSHEIVVIRVTLGSDVVQFARRGVGYDELLETLRALARAAGEAVRVADYVAVGGGSRDVPAAVNLFEASPRKVSEGMMLALRWLDATLLRAVDAWPSSHGELNLRADAAKQLLHQRTWAPGSDATPETTMREHALALASYLGNAADGDERLVRLVRQLAMRTTELETFLLCLAPDLDLRYGRIFGYLQDDASRRWATLDLIASLLGDPLDVRAALGHSRALFESRLLAQDPARLPFADEPLRVDPAVTAWLLSGVPTLVADRPLTACVRHAPWPGVALLTRPSDYTQMNALSRLLDPRLGRHRWLLLTGDSDGWRALTEGAQQSTLSTARIDAAAIGALAPAERQEVAARLARDIALDNVAPVVDATGLGTVSAAIEGLEGLASALARTRRPCALIAETPDRLVAALPAQGLRQLSRSPINAAMRTSYYKQAAKTGGLELSLSDQQAAALASVFALTLPQIEQAAHLAAACSTRQCSEADREQHLREACRRIAAPDLPKVARRVPAVFTLSQIVLPAAQKAQLEEVVANVRLSSQVLDQWGLGARLPYGRGVTALFHGPSGCGKTVAAQGIAHELGADLYVVDLSRVMSKWVGETEKGLDTAFTEAENAGAVLLFDEADALFSRRIANAGDSYARHSNIEIAFLLQRMESFTGLAILTTNLRQNMDEAFLRRLRFVVEFPKPDAAAREKIWQQCFHGVTQLSDAVNLADLARRIHVSGGSIRQIALRAAFAAAADHEKILTRHVHEAARAELLKLGMSSAAGEFITQAA